MKFTVHDESGKVIGTVWADNGDEAWRVARACNPGANHLRPSL